MSGIMSCIGLSTYDSFVTHALLFSICTVDEQVTATQAMLASYFGLHLLLTIK